MEMNLDVGAAAGGWQVRLTLSLDRGEISALFLAGDILVSWPTEDLIHGEGEAVPARSCMFLSEIVSRPAGIAPVYNTQDSAERAARSLASQVSAALPTEAAREGAMVESEDPIYAMMSAYLDFPGAIAAILVSDQGLVINSARAEAVDAETVSALVVDIVAAAERFGRESGAGALETLTLEFAGLNLLLAPFGSDCMLALVGHPGAFSQTGVRTGM